MKYSSLLIPLALALIVLSSYQFWVVTSTNNHQAFVQCLSSISKVIYTPINSSYFSVLNFSIQNLRFSKPNTPKPIVIITPTHVSQIQVAIICSRTHGVQIRTRSGGHDNEGLSYVAHNPFIILDLINLRSISIDVENKTAWVQSGATVGELYYKIAEKSRTLAFPAAVFPTVGVGGSISGGGYGYILRKYGLSADNVIDAYLVDANGEFLDRETMGEDLFWAIRGGGGGSFGIVVAWKLKLVSVPATVTICFSNRTEEDGAMKLIYEWQYVADKLDENLHLGILLNGGNITNQGGKPNPTALFLSSFLGKANELLEILNKKFPQLGVRKKDCTQTSWIQSTLIEINGSPTNNTSLQTLLIRKSPNVGSFKLKSDYIQQPIPQYAIQGIWERLKSLDVKATALTFIPYGGKMCEISESEIPFPHRAGNLYMIGYLVAWEEKNKETEERHLNWIREIYRYMTPFVSKSPRAAYVNYRDLDIGSNEIYGKTSYEQARVWGLKYFGQNFNRLVDVKTKVDPYDFFSHEQSIPTLSPL